MSGGAVAPPGAAAVNNTSTCHHFGKGYSGGGESFPYLSRGRANGRVTEVGSRCRQFGIQGVTLCSLGVMFFS
jgi:hypothetical protein